MIGNIKKYKIEKDRLPSSLIISGVLYLSVVAVMACSILFIIPVQEKITGKVEIHMSGIPFEVRAKSDGMLYLLVDDGQEVKKGELISSVLWNINEEEDDFIRSVINASYQLEKEDDIARLKNMALRMDSMVNLPGLQGNIREIVSAVNKYQLLKKGNDPAVVIESYLNEIADLSRSVALFDSLEVLYESNIALIRNQLKLDSVLWTSGGMSRRAFEDRKMTLYNERTKMVNNKISRQETINAINEKYSIVESVKNNYSGNIARFKSEIDQSIVDLRKKYYDISAEKLIYSPFNGTVSKRPTIVTGLELSQGQVVCTIVPESPELPREIYLYAGINRAGEIKNGQKVFIDLDEYPSRDFGSIPAEVGQINSLPEEGFYRISLTTDLPLTTDYGYTISPQPLLQGTGKIYTNRMNIIQKIRVDLQARNREVWRGSPGSSDQMPAD